MRRAVPRFAIPIVSLALLVLVGCSSPERPEPIEPLRLVDPADSLFGEAGGVESVGQPPRWLTDAEIVADRDGLAGRVVEVPMFADGDRSTRDSRAALLAPTGSRYRFYVEVPDGAELRTALGYVILDESIGQSVRFRIRIEPDEAALAEAAGASGEDAPESPGDATILDETVEIRGEGGWRPVALDLSRWSGLPVVLDFSVEPAVAEPATTETAAEEALVWGGWAAPELMPRPGDQDGYDVLLVSIDTLRADRLGAYGYERRSTSPNLDRLASSGVVFETAVAQAPWTRPSHRSLFTGLFPVSNGGASNPPLARVLWREGWRTGALTGGGQVDARFGFHDGFETYRVHYWAEDLEAVRDWYERGDGRRNFLFLHTFSVHDPYDDARFAEAEGLDRGRIGASFGKDDWMAFERTLTPGEQAWVDALYDGGIARLDESLGELFAWLEESGRLERTVVIVTSDHGEQLFEHGGWRHGSTLFDYELLVPLIVHWPPELRREIAAEAPEVDWTIEEPVRLVDVYPTLLEILELDATTETDDQAAAHDQGHSLVPLLRGEPFEPDPAFAENVNSPTHEQKALRGARWKFVWWIPEVEGEPEYFRLYDLGRDPLEVDDLSTERPQTIERLREQIERIMAGGSGSLEETVPDDLPPDLLERLRSLGYVD